MTHQIFRIRPIQNRIKMIVILFKECYLIIKKIIKINLTKRILTMKI